jgi:hypothetical protein
MNLKIGRSLPSGCDDTSLPTTYRYHGTGSCKRRSVELGTPALRSLEGSSTCDRRDSSGLREAGSLAARTNNQE